MSKPIQIDQKHALHGNEIAEQRTGKQTIQGRKIPELNTQRTHFQCLYIYKTYSRKLTGERQKKKSYILRVQQMHCGIVYVQHIINSNERVPN